MRIKGYLNMILGGITLFSVRPLKDLAQGLSPSNPFNQFLAGNLDLILVAFALLFIGNSMRYFARSY